MPAGCALTASAKAADEPRAGPYAGRSCRTWASAWTSPINPAVLSATASAALSGRYATM
jgi:hypothetical protein